jgi:hypothetical protein
MRLALKRSGPVASAEVRDAVGAAEAAGAIAGNF